MLPHRSLEPHAYQLQHGAVSYPLLHARHKAVVRDAVEVPFQVGIVDGGVTCRQVPLDRLKRISSRATRSETVGTRQEIRLEDRLQNQLRGGLDQTITHGGNAQGAFSAAGLGDAHPPHRSRPVAPRLQGLSYSVQEGVDAPWGGDHILDVHTVHARRSVVGGDLIPGSLEHVVPVYAVIQRVKPVVRLLLRLDVELLPQSEDLLRQTPAIHRKGIRQRDPLASRRGSVPIRQAGASFRELSVTTVGTLGSTGVTPLPRYYGPVRSPPRRRHGYGFPCRRAGYDPQRGGSPRFLDRSIAARRPHSPRGAGSPHLSVASRSVQASSSPADWPLPLCVTRPNRVRSRYGSQLRLPRLRPPHCWKRPLGRLHV